MDHDNIHEHSTLKKNQKLFLPVSNVENIQQSTLHQIRLHNKLKAGIIGALLHAKQGIAYADGLIKFERSAMIVKANEKQMKNLL